MDDQTPASIPADADPPEGLGPDLADSPADARDRAASVRDRAAEARDSAVEVAAHQAAVDRTAAASDRSAAALDRRDAASDRRAAADALANSYRDDLTGALTRDAGRDQLRRALDRARRTGEPFVVAYLDVDSLKGVNDALGHASGDRLLREVGSALRQGLRSYDLVVRYGGDEFVCGLPGSRLPDADRRLAKVSALLAEGLAGASVSVGLAEVRGEEDLDGLIARADCEMYARRERQRANSR